jgi:hypothetical protein
VSYFISFDNDDPCDAKVWKYNVFNVDSSTGWALWRLNLESDADIYGTPAMLEDNSIFVPAKSNLHRILPDMTSYLAVQGDGQRIESSPAIDGGKLIFVGSNGGRFYCLCADCPETPILWKYPTTDEPLQTVNVGGTVSTASIISSPAIGDDTHHSVYVGASDGNVYAFYDGIKIYGTVKDNSGQPIPAVKISISSEVLKDNRETFTDPEGKYEFAGVENDTYTVTPDKTLYYFEPDSSEEIIYNDMEINFTGYLGYSISGYVRDSEGNGKPNVTVSITGDNDFEDDTTTDSDGMFEFQGLREGTYTLTPSLKGYEFTPESYPVTITTEDKELGDKFTISEPDDDSVNLSISGYIDVSGLDNATIAEIRVELLDENNQEIDDFPPVTLDNSGLFLFPGVDNNKMYIIKPVLKGYCFEPASQTETVSGRDITDITFLIIEGFSITGKVTNFRGIGVEGVNLAVEDDESLNTETNEDGTYTFTGLEAGKYTVTIDQEGYTSLPKSREANIAQKNIEYINFFVYPTCPDVFVNIPFIGSEGTLVNIFGTNFGWEEPEEEVTYSIGDTGVTLEGGVYFGTEDPETWVKADVVSWINFKIVAEAPEGFGIFSVWVVNETACNYTSAMSTNLFILLP